MADTAKSERVQLMMSRAEVTAIDEWAFKNRVRGRSEAIRQLVKDGLEQNSFAHHADLAASINHTRRVMDLQTGLTPHELRHIVALHDKLSVVLREAAQLLATEYEGKPQPAPGLTGDTIRLRSLG